MDHSFCDVCCRSIDRDCTYRPQYYVMCVVGLQTGAVCMDHSICDVCRRSIDRDCTYGP